VAVNDNLAASFRVLEIEPGASLEEAKRARRLLAKVWHPDRFPEDSVLQERGRQKLTEINRAYKVIESYYLGREDPDVKGRETPPTKKRGAHRRLIWAAAGVLLGLFFIADVWLRFEEARRSSASPLVAVRGGEVVTSGEIVFAEPAQESPVLVSPAVAPASTPPSPPDRIVATSPPISRTKATDILPIARTSEDEVVKQIWERAREKARLEAAARAAELEKERLAASNAIDGKKGGLVLRPKALSQPSPVFPKELENRGVQHGWAIVGFTVETDGRVSSATAVRSSNPEFGRAAVEGVRKWQFEPAAKDGRKPSLRLEVPIMFSANAPHSDKNSSTLISRYTNTAPKLRTEIPPIYPTEMQAKGVQGTVVVEFVVTKEGEVTEAKVANVTTLPELGGDDRREAHLKFGAAALSAVTQRKYFPGLSAGEPIEAQMTVPVEFKAVGRSK
jgi:TonB family protein